MSDEQLDILRECRLHLDRTLNDMTARYLNHPHGVVKRGWLDRLEAVQAHIEKMLEGAK